MKKILLLSSLSVFFPLVSYAAWWNPSTWFQNEPQTPIQVLPAPQASTTPCIPQIKTVTVTDPSDKALIASLQSQISTLQGLLAQKSSTLPSSNPVTKTISTNDSEVKNIQFKLSQLDSVENMMNNFATSTVILSMRYANLFSALSQVTDMQGNLIFSSDAFLPHVVSMAIYDNGNMPSFDMIRAVAEKARNTLNLELEQAQAVQ